jgi:hypothetical protein
MPWGKGSMATDRGEQQRQQQELEEIRRRFAEMGARMGSMFEPAEPEEPGRSRKALLPPAAAPSPSGSLARPRWWWAAALVLLFLAGTAFGYILPKGDGGSGSPSSSGATTATSRAPVAAPPPATVIKTKVSVPGTCVDTAELADEVISRLTRNIRDNRLAEVLRDYTIASQACRREALP